MKKQITILMLLAFLGLSVNSAFAQFGGGDGSQANPYQISTVTHLAQLATDVNGGENYNDTYFILTANLDLNVAPYNSGTGWAPIGSFAENIYFAGNFNGNGKKVSNLFINDPELYSAGLFGVVRGGVVENLGMENVNITADSYVGGLTGNVYENSSIKNCYSTGNISGNNAVGGVAGSVGSASITDSHSTGTVSGESGVGGVAGNVFDASITNCYSTGNISVTNDIVGGVVGGVYDHTSITNCHSTGNISGNWGTGGVVGLMEYYSSITNCHSTGNISGDGSVSGVAGSVSSNCSIKNCYSKGDVSGNENVGGIAGSFGNDGSITDSYSTGNVSGTGDYVGGIVGSIAGNSSISNCYSTGNVSGNEYVGGVSGDINDGSSISNCAALNPSIKGNGIVGRITGNNSASTLTNNIAFDGILNKDVTTNWFNKGLTGKDGEDMTCEAINTNSTLGNRFTSPVWTTQKGKLPGLNGNTVAMPEHLRIPGMVYITTETLPNGNVGASYSATLTAAGDTPITWSIIANALPLGLTLNANTGVISGTPTTKGPFSFTVKVVNSVGDDTKNLSINIGDGVGIETITNYKLGITVYPNPTTGQLTIETSDMRYAICDIRLFDMMGRQIFIGQSEIGQSEIGQSEIGKSEIGKSEIQINLSHFPTGIYFLRVDGQTVKVIKN